jgi:hypothetical protein
MSKSVSNEEIVKRFVDSKAVDFKAIGNLVTELGPSLAASKLDHKMVLIGRRFIIACMMPAAELAELAGDLRTAELGAAVRQE